MDIYFHNTTWKKRDESYFQKPLNSTMRRAMEKLKNTYWDWDYNYESNPMLTLKSHRLKTLPVDFK